MVVEGAANLPKHTERTYAYGYFNRISKKAPHFQEDITFPPHTYGCSSKKPSSEIGREAKDRP